MEASVNTRMDGFSSSLIRECSRIYMRPTCADAHPETATPIPYARHSNSPGVSMPPIYLWSCRPAIARVPPFPKLVLASYRVETVVTGLRMQSPGMWGVQIKSLPLLQS